MKCIRLLMILGASLSWSPPANAQMETGPKVGAKVGGFKAHAVTGEDAGKVVDVVAARKDKPTVYVFVKAGDWDRPMARFLKKMDEEFSNGIDGVSEPVAVAVWLTDDQEKSRDYLPRAQESLKFLHTTLTVFDGAAEGPESWGLNAGARLVAVVVRDGKVSGSFAFGSLNETDVPKVLKALKP